MELQNIGKRIKEVRQNHNITQRELAQILGITASALSSYEKGITNPSISVIADIARYAKVSTDWLLGLTDTTTAENNITTYADLIKILVSLSKVNGLDLMVQPLQENYEYGNYYVETYCGVLFDKKNAEFNNFFDDWKKMQELFKNGSIDEEVYNLWIEKTLKKFNNISIVNNNNTEFAEEERKVLKNDEEIDLPF